MSVIDLSAAVAAALRTDGHYSQCQLLECVFCQETAARAEAMVLAAAPVITTAVWAMRPDAEDGLAVTQQWAAKLPGGQVRERRNAGEARTFAHAWGGQLLVRDVYTGASEWRVSEDFSTLRKTETRG